MNSRNILAIASLAAATGGVFASDSISIDSVTQRWPWNNKVDITYTVKGGQDVGKEIYAKVVFTATINGTEYTIDGSTVGASGAEGKHTVTWFPDSGLRATDATMSAKLIATDVPSGDDYMIVDLTDGSVVYEGLYASQDTSNARYTTEDTQGVYKTTKLVMRKVPAGTYTTSDGGHASWTTQYDFYLGIFPVTRGQYNQYDSSKSYNASVASGQTAEYKPADNFSYLDVRGGEYITTNAIPQITSDSGKCFLQRLNYRTSQRYAFDIPTWAMATIAARAGTTTTYHWGSDSSAETATLYATYGTNYGGDASTSDEVDAKLPNPWGFYSMSGNGWERALDCFDGRALNARTDPFIPSNPSNNNRVLVAGGAWTDPLKEPAEAWGNKNYSDTVGASIFRVSWIRK